jgi:hypothetical protein
VTTLSYESYHFCHSVWLCSMHRMVMGAPCPRAQQETEQTLRVQRHIAAAQVHIRKLNGDNENPVAWVEMDQTTVRFT